MPAILYGRTNIPLCQVKCKSLKFYSKLHNYIHLNNKVIEEKGLIIKRYMLSSGSENPYTVTVGEHCGETVQYIYFIPILFFIILMVTTY